MTWIRTLVLLASLSASAACASRTAGVITETRPTEVRLVADAHCLYGCPRSAPRTNQVIVRPLYALSNNGATKFADWVAYVVDWDLAGSDGSRNWAPDPDLDESVTLEEDDYAGASSTYNYDLGHQAPLASFANAEDWRETNFLSNITPQNGHLNRGRWARLERAERELSREIEGPVYVITGPLYERRMPTLPSADERHRVPSGYWKVVGLTDGRASGFIFANAEGEGNFCEGEVSISEIERRAGLNLFPDASLRDLETLTDMLGCAENG